MSAMKKFREMLEQVITAHPKRRPLVRGRLVPDPVPMAPPVGYKKQPSMVDQIRNMVRSEALAREAAAAGRETFDEANDFNVDDDFDPMSPWEEQFDPVDNEINRRLTDAEFDAMVASRLEQAKRYVGVDDGNRRALERRSDDPRSGSGQFDPKREGKSGSQSKSDNERSVRDAAGGVREVED